MHGPLVHIGHRKTATTWFQEEYFPNHQAFEIVGNSDEVYKDLVWPEREDFEPVELRGRFRSLFDAVRRTGKVPVVSVERLSGNPDIGAPHRARTARRMASVFPNAKIWVQVREQRSSMASNYKQFVRAGGRWPLGFYLFGALDRGLSTPRIEWWQYHRAVEHLAMLFGEDRLLVTLFEQFKHDPGRVVEQVEDHAGAPSDVAAWDSDRRPARALSTVSTGIMRWLNRWVLRTRKYGPPSGLGLPVRELARDALMTMDDVLGEPVGSGRIKRQVEKMVPASFARSNQRLQTFVDEPLDPWGYDLDTHKEGSP